MERDYMTERDLVVGSASPPTADVPTKDRIISVRLTSRLGERVERAARARGWDMSTFIRDVLARATSTLGSDAAITTTAGPFSELEIQWVTDHSGVAGEPEATPSKGSENVQDATPIETPVTTPDQGSVPIVAGGVTVPDEALDVALTARRLHQFRDQHTCRCGFGPADGAAWDRHMVEVAVTAAAPLIAAQALREAAQAMVRPGEVFDSLALEWAVNKLRQRADELERGDDR